MQTVQVKKPTLFCLLLSADGQSKQKKQGELKGLGRIKKTGGQVSKFFIPSKYLQQSNF